MKREYKKGDVVKIVRKCPHDTYGSFLGLTSELIKPPTEHDYGWNFEMLYGNLLRKEYSGMNFYAEDIIEPATNGEKLLYLFMKTLDISLLKGAELTSKRLHEDNFYNKYKIGNNAYLNIFNKRIYVNTEAGMLELYNAELGSWVTGVPADLRNKYVVHFKKDYFDGIFVPRLDGKVIITSTPKGVGQFDQKDIGMDPSILLL